jgi:hypothetical protein
LSRWLILRLRGVAGVPRRTPGAPVRYVSARTFALTVAIAAVLTNFPNDGCTPGRMLRLSARCSRIECMYPLRHSVGPRGAHPQPVRVCVRFVGSGESELFKESPGCE